MLHISELLLEYATFPPVFHELLCKVITFLERGKLVLFLALGRVRNNLFIAQGSHATVQKLPCQLCFLLFRFVFLGLLWVLFLLVFSAELLPYLVDSLLCFDRVLDHFLTAVGMGSCFDISLLIRPL